MPNRARPRGWEEFEPLLRSRSDALRLLAYRLLEDRDEVDDALQESFVKAYEAWPRFRIGQGSVEGWLYRITYRVCLDRLRSRTRQPALSPETTARSATEQDPAETVINRLSVAKALTLLGPESRAAVVLVDALGVDYATAARILDVPRGTLASRLHTARAVVRDALGGEC